MSDFAWIWIAHTLKRSFLAPAAALFFLWSAAPVSALQVDHDLSVTLEPSQARLRGVDRVQVVPEGVRELGVTLSAALDDLRVEIDNRPAEVRRAGRTLRIALPEIPSGTTVSVTFRYAGVFDDEAPIRPMNTDNPGYGVTGTIGERGAFLLPGAGWYPHIEADQATYRVRVEAPSGTIGVTAGRSLGVHSADGKTVSTWQVASSPHGLSLSAGPYGVRETRVGGVTVATYLTAANRDLEDTYLKASAQYIEQYQALFGPYPFEKFAVVENFFPTGYGFPSYTLLGSRVLRLPFIPRTSLGHEIAHCWWGNGVLVDASGGNWSEGLTSYVADYLSKEQESEEAARAHRRQWLRNHAAVVKPSNAFPLSRFQGRVDPVTKVIGYDKAAMVFHMLRREIGEAAFWGGLRDLYAGYRFRRASWDDLRNAFEARSGLDLTTFFRQWVQRTGAPQITFQDVQRRTTGDGWEVFGRIVQEGPPYAMQTALRLETARDPVHRTITVSGRTTPFRISSPNAPVSLRFDPEWDLFRWLHASELPPSINALRGAKGVRILVADPAGPDLERAAAMLATALGLKDARRVAKPPAGNRDMEDGHWILVGWPGRSSLPEDLPEPVTFPGQQVRLDGTLFDHKEDAFFGVFEHPRSPGRVAALFLPNTEAALEAVVRKIPHYGKYSYLVFRGGRNLEKGVWPVASSPLIVRWPDQTPEPSTDPEE